MQSLFILSIVTALIFWLIPIISIMLTSEDDFNQPTDRVLWFILVFFLPPIGGVCYYARFLLGGVGKDAFTPASFQPKGQSFEAPDLKRAGD